MAATRLNSRVELAGDEFAEGSNSTGRVCWVEFVGDELDWVDKRPGTFHHNDSLCGLRRKVKVERVKGQGVAEVMKKVS